MKRFDRKLYVHSLTERNNTIKNNIVFLDKNLSNYHEIKDSLSKELESNRRSIKEIFESATRILIATIQDASRDSYQHIYYLADLDIIQSNYSTNYNDYHDGAIDLRSFFSQIGLPQNHTIDTSITLWFTIEILRRIINDLFSKKQYTNWEEVKSDLTKIPENYKLPEYREHYQRYERRVLKK